MSQTQSLLDVLGEPLLKMVMTRVEDRLARAESPPSVVLPSEKTSFPKLLCLDQNKWIQMARAHHQVSVDPDAMAALVAVRAATSRGTLVVPMMPTNLEEVMERQDPSRRVRIADFLVSTSGNFSFRNWRATDAAEVEYSIRRNILGQTAPAPIRPTLIHWGVDAAVSAVPLVFQTRDEFLDVVVNQTMKEPEVSAAMLVLALDNETILGARAIDNKGAASVEAHRAANVAIPAADRRRVEMFNLLDGGSFAEVAHGISATLGVSPRLWEMWRSREDLLLRLTGDMPSVDVEYSLITARERNACDRTHPNDFKDMAFLKQAIAYGNIVVTENRWAHLANAEGIAKRHGTSVIAALKSLPQMLEAEGCT